MRDHLHSHLAFSGVLSAVVVAGTVSFIINTLPGVRDSSYKATHTQLATRLRWLARDRRPTSKLIS